MSEQQWHRADAHIHLFKNGYHADYSEAWARRNELQCYDALRQKHGIARALVVGFEGKEQFAGNNRNLARWGKQHSWMAPLCYVNCQRIPSLTTLRYPFRGVALYVSSEQDVQNLASWPQRFYDKFNERRAIISINSAPPLLAQLAPFMERLENCSVLMSHLGLPGRFTNPPSKRLTAAALSDLVTLAKFPNVNVKVSGLYAISDPAYDFPHRSAVPLLRAIHENFGPQKLLWGSDFSPCLEHISFVQAVEALQELNESLNWPEDEMQQIYGGNLLTLLGA